MIWRCFLLDEHWLMCFLYKHTHILSHTCADHTCRQTQWVLAQKTVFVDAKNEIESMFGCLFLPRMCSLFMTQRGVVFMQMPHNHHKFPCSHPYPPHPHLLTLLALSTTLWSPASCAWSIMTGSRTQTMMGHCPRWQQSPGSFFKRQRTTSEQHWGRHLEVRKAQAPP